MQRRKSYGIFAGLTAVALLAGAAWAAAQQAGEAAAPPAPQAHGAHGGPGSGFTIPGLMSPHMLEHLADQLQLSTEQRQTIKGFFDQARPGFQQLHKQLRANTELLMDTRPDDPNYTSIVTNVGQASSELAAQFVLQASQLRSQVFGVLTDDQKSKLAQLQANMTAHMHQLHGAAHGAAPAGSAPMPN